jgi:hypothetical protein
MKELRQHKTEQDSSRAAHRERAAEQRDAHLRPIACLRDLTPSEFYLLPDQFLGIP